LIKISNYIIGISEYENDKNLISLSKIYFTLMDFFILLGEGVHVGHVIDILFLDLFTDEEKKKYYELKHLNKDNLSFKSINSGYNKNYEKHKNLKLQSQEFQEENKLKSPNYKIKDFKKEFNINKFQLKKNSNSLENSKIVYLKADSFNVDFYNRDLKIPSEKLTIFDKEFELEGLIGHKSIEKIYKTYPGLEYIMKELDTLIDFLSKDFYDEQNSFDLNSRINLKDSFVDITLNKIIINFNSIFGNNQIQNLINFIQMKNFYENEEVIFILTFNKKMMDLIIKFYKVILIIINNYEAYKNLYHIIIKENDDLQNESDYNNYEIYLKIFNQKVKIFENKIISELKNTEVKKFDLKSFCLESSDLINTQYKIFKNLEKEFNEDCINFVLFLIKNNNKNYIDSIIDSCEYINKYLTDKSLMEKFIIDHLDNFQLDFAQETEENKKYTGLKPNPDKLFMRKNNFGQNNSKEKSYYAKKLTQYRLKNEINRNDYCEKNKNNEIIKSLSYQTKRKNDKDFVFEFFKENDSCNFSMESYEIAGINADYHDEKHLLFQSCMGNNFDLNDKQKLKDNHKSHIKENIIPGKEEKKNLKKNLTFVNLNKIEEKDSENTFIHNETEKNFVNIKKQNESDEEKNTVRNENKSLILSEKNGRDQMNTNNNDIEKNHLNYKNNFYYFNFLQLVHIMKLFNTCIYDSSYYHGSFRLIPNFLYITRFLKELLEIDDCKTNKKNDIIINNCFNLFFNFNWLISSKIKFIDSSFDSDIKNEDFSCLMRAEILNLLVAFLEERGDDIPRAFNEKIYSHLNAKIIFNEIVECFNKIFPDKINIKFIKSKYLLRSYILDDSIYNNKYCQLAELYYKLIRRLKPLYKELKFQFEKIKVSNNRNKNTLEEIYEIEEDKIYNSKYFEFYDFLMTVGKEIEVKFKETNGNVVFKKLHFFKSPKCFWLNNHFKQTFLDNMPSSSLGEKLHHLSENTDLLLFCINICYNSKPRFVWVWKFYRDFSYYIAEFFNFILVLLINFILLYKYTKKPIGTYYKEDLDTQYIPEIKSVENSQSYYVISKIVITTCIIEIIFIIIWSYFRYSIRLHYLTYKANNKNYYFNLFKGN